MVVTPRVLHVVPSLRGGGAEAVCAALVQGLGPHGFAATGLVCIGDAGAPGMRALGRATQRDPRLLWDLRRALAGLCREGGPALVHTHLGWPLYLVRLARAGLPGGAAVLHVHTEHSTGGVRRRPTLRALERSVYRGVDRVYAISPGVRDALAGWLGSRTVPIDVVWNGARTLALARRAAPQGAVRLVSVGALADHKGLDVALDAVARVGSAVVEYRLVGVGSEREALERQAAALGLADRVRFVGWADDPTPHLHWAHALLMPSRREGFGLAAIEALSTGLPVLGARVSGLIDALEGVGAAATLVAPDDPQALAAAITALAALSDEAYAAMAAPARAHALRFDEPTMVRRYAEAYRRLLEERGARG